jgi:hypothetical protein
MQKVRKKDISRKKNKRGQNASGVKQNALFFLAFILPLNLKGSQRQDKKGFKVWLSCLGELVGL